MAVVDRRQEADPGDAPPKRPKSERGASRRDAPGSDGKAKPRSARRRSRELAVQGLYQWLVAGEDSGVIEAYLSEAEGFDKADREHFRHLLHGGIREIEALHAAIAPHIDRKLEELSPVEHATLLVGTYEFLHHAEIPYRVIINEAVELAKTLGGTDGYKYVNGVLDRVAAKLRPNG